MTDPTPRRTTAEQVISDLYRFRNHPASVASAWVFRAVDEAIHLLSTPPDPEVCLCAAVRCADGSIFRGHRHGDALRAAGEAGHNVRPPSAEQGFLTSRGRFVTRREGLIVQDTAGVPSADPRGYRYDMLYSEDLY